MSLRLGRCVLLLVLWAGILGLCAPDPAQSQAPKPKVDPAKTVVVKYVTLQGKDLSMSKALQAVQQQTGVEVRKGTDDDPPVRGELMLKNVPFWQALDEIAKAADVRVSVYHKDGKIAMVPGPYREVPTSYSGPFRITLKKLIAVRDLETGTHGCLAMLEVAWQPPFQPFLVETQPETFGLKDDKGLDQELPPLEKSAGYVGSDRHAIEMNVALPALRRDVKRIGLKGSLRMIGSAQSLNFTFEKLDKSKQEKEGVSVEIVNFLNKKGDENESLWTIEVRLKYPASTIKESHDISAWLVRSKAELVARKGGGRLLPNGGTGSDPEQFLMQYRWEDDPDKKIKLEDAKNWRFEYTTPGPVIEVPIPFEFKDVPLP